MNNQRASFTFLVQVFRQQALFNWVNFETFLTIFFSFWIMNNKASKHYICGLSCFVWWKASINNGTKNHLSSEVQDGYKSNVNYGNKPMFFRYFWYYFLSKIKFNCNASFAQILVIFTKYLNRFAFKKIELQKSI